MELFAKMRTTFVNWSNLAIKGHYMWEREIERKMEGGQIMNRNKE